MAYLVLFVAFIIGLLWLFQVVLLEDFYRNYKMTQVVRSAEAIVQNLQHEDLASLAEQLASQNDVCIMLMDAEGNETISAEGLRVCLVHRMNEHQRDKWASDAAESGQPLVKIFATGMRNAERYDSERFTGLVPERSEDQAMTLLFV